MTHSSRLSESQEISSADEIISHVYFFTEHLNAFVAGVVRRASSEPPSLQSFVLDVRKYLTSSASSWSDRSEFIREANRLTITPSINASLVNSIAAHLLEPAEVFLDNESNDWRLAGRAFLPAVPSPDELYENFWFYNIGGLADFATAEPRSASTLAVAKVKESKAYFWDEVLDPLLVAQGYLMQKAGVRSESQANHLIQRWFRNFFSIPYDVDMKYALSILCHSINSLFFGDPSARRSTEALRSSTIGTLLFLREVTNTLGTALNTRSSTTDHATVERRALGLCVALRFCRAIRVRYQWFDSPGPTFDSDTSLRRFTIRQCLTAFRPVEYSHTVTRIFGSISDIVGLNFIFRGAILPRSMSGRSMMIEGPPGAGKTVLALQKLAGVAARGGFAVYISLEETRELLADRLVMFNLTRGSDFAIIESVDELRALISKIEDGDEEHQGVLLLFGSLEGKRYNLLRVLQGLRRMTEKLWRWRAVAIDSVNALQFSGGTLSRLFRGPLFMRQRLRTLVQRVEEERYLGLFLSEPGGRGLSSLPFLADTVIGLTFDEATRGRWIEIRKCRSQNFHAGRHSFRIVGGEGIRIYPSLAALRSSLRRKLVASLSEERRIPLPTTVGISVGFEHGRGQLTISEKSSTLILGPPSSGKTLLALGTALAESRSRRSLWKGRGVVPSVLVVTFRTAETKMQQVIGRYSDLRAYAAEGQLSSKWFAPGDNISAEQFIFAVRAMVKESRRRGRAIDRVVFDEVESAEYMLPYLDKEPLFWTTVLQFLGAEALTGIFVLEEGEENSRAGRELRAGVDYIFKTVGVKLNSDEPIAIRAEKIPDSELREDREWSGQEETSEQGKSEE